MPRIERLPPPPAVPVRSPPVTVVGEVEEQVPGLAVGSQRQGEGLPLLEARVHSPPGALRAIVLCHPHPLYGGSMHSPVILAIAKALSDKASERVAWARFNFRGVGASGGAYEDGRGEVNDVGAVIEHLRRRAPDARVTVCGHSFGSWVGLRGAASVAARDSAFPHGAVPDVERVLLIAPSVRFFGFGGDGDGFAGYKAVFIGSRDEYCDVDEARSLADKLGADLRVFEGADHHFMNSRRALAEAALPVLAPEVWS